jgi:hypothetical protein
MQKKHMVAALRRTWDALANGAFAETGAQTLTAEHVRQYVSKHIAAESRDSTTNRKFWSPLTEDEQYQLLEDAFPDDTYTRPERPMKAGDEGIAPSRP